MGSERRKIDMTNITFESSPSNMIIESLKIYAESADSFRTLLNSLGSPDEDGEVVDIAFLGWRGSIRCYDYLVLAEDKLMGQGWMVCHFYVSFSPNGILTGDYSAAPIAAYDSLEEAEEIFKIRSKIKKGE